MQNLLTGKESGNSLQSLVPAPASAPWVPGVLPTLDRAQIPGKEGWKRRGLVGGLSWAWRTQDAGWTPTPGAHPGPDQHYSFGFKAVCRMPTTLATGAGVHRPTRGNQSGWGWG